MKIWTILSNIRVPRPSTKIKISNFPSEFYVEPKYMKKIFKSDFHTVIFVNPIG